MLPDNQLEIPAEVAAACVDDDTFRSIMSAFPTGVTVVTTLDEQDRPCGLTCSAACSVSRTPPLLLVCLHSHSRVLAAIRRRECFGVNFLRDNRAATSALFAARNPDRFGLVAWRPSRLGGLPLLPADTIAYAECRLVGTLAAGDHTALVGAIVDGRAEGDTLGPLMYWRRRYGGWPVDEDELTTALTLATEG